MKVCISGMSGFLGSNVAEALRERGHTVRALPVRLGEPVAAASFRDAEAFVHCAHDFRPGMRALNVEGSRALFEAAAGRHRIFISSHSARPDAVGDYGVSKYEIERFWLAGGETVVRPGLVIGNGGAFGRTLAALRRARVVPLIDGGRDLVAVLAIADFCSVVLQIVESGERSTANLFVEAMPSMRQMVEAIRPDARVIAVPFGMALAGIRIVEDLGLSAPFSSDSLRMLSLNRTPVHESNLRRYLLRDPVDFSAMIVQLYEPR